MSSQQKQIIAKRQKHHTRLIQKEGRETQSRIIYPQINSTEPENSLRNSKIKSDLKKFEQNILKQILQKHHKSSSKYNLSNLKLTQKSQSHMNSYKHINIQRKLSRSKSKSKKELSLNKLAKQKEMFEKSHLNNMKILRQKLLSGLNRFDDYQMINIQNSIPILNEAKILKLLTSLEETKSRIQQKNLSEGRVKEEAKFIYYLWKMISEQFITTRHLKQIIILLNQLNKNDLVDTLSELYDRSGQIVRMFVECWLRIKLDKFCYDRISSKQKVSYQNTMNYSGKFNGKDTRKQRQIYKKINKAEIGRIQANGTQENDQIWPRQQEQINVKFLQPTQQKKLIQRLYKQKKDFVNRKQRVKTLNDQQKESLELQKCTFKPLLTSSVPRKSSSRSNLIMEVKGKIKQDITENENERNDQSVQRGLLKVKGFEKAVKRMKNGQSQSKIKQQLLSYYSIGQNYEKIRQKPMNPPKFLSRQRTKKQELILFAIQFQIGRYKVKVKIHPTDTQKSVSKKISKIYGLKPEQQQQIRTIVSMQLNNHYKKVGQQVSQLVET